MKKTITVFALIISAIAFGQVGINTTTPHPSADLELGSNNKALYLNRVANTAAVANPQAGMVIYDLTDECVKAYQSNPAAWSGCLDGNGGSGVAAGTITSLLCASATANPTGAAQNIAYSGTLTVPYNGGNGGIYTAQTIASTGVTGLTATLDAGLFATGNGNLSLSVTGTPLTSGTASFAITIGGQSCAVTLLVTTGSGGVLPSGLVLAQDRKQWIVSVYDQNYLPYTAPTGPATTATPVNPDGTNETVTVNIAGSITTTGITIQIPIVSGGGSVTAWSNIITVPANLTENNTATQVQLSWAAQAVTDTYITATIKAISSPLLAKKLDINAGIGNDYLGILLGTFQYPYNSAGVLTSLQLRDIPGIPDRMFGKLDNDPAQGQRHNFLYLPVLAENGRIWLNNNLGAAYTKVGEPDFSPTQQATDINDFKAFGSLFQWGRKPDGHELITWVSSTSAGTKSGSTSTLSDEPNHALFIAGYPDWRVTPDSSLWTVVSAPNNPCPYGFRVPTLLEFTIYLGYVPTEAYGSGDFGYNNSLKFTSSLNRGDNQLYANAGYYATSTANQAGMFTVAWPVSSNGRYNMLDFVERKYGTQVRCIMD